MGQIRNILFVMYDQLRHDYLSCAGHPTMKTPNFDRLAAMGVRFSRAYVQSPVCGASRMSFYTGRYVHSHGAAWNNFPLKVGEATLGDHLRRLGVESWLVGKTHMRADAEGMARLGLSPDSVIGARVADCGFDVWIRDDGLVAEGPEGFYDSKRSPYNEWLRQQGYEGHNPWHSNANSGIDENGDLASGWLLKNAAEPANIREEDSETPWLTRQAMAFIEGHKGGAPWLCHLSYIKPHWPYIVPAPWHDLYGPDDVVPPVRDMAERDDPHPVFNAFMNNQPGQAFSRDDVRLSVIPAYMGLVAQCDDQFGKLLDYLQASGRMDDTMIVLTSDHGDYLGDHWMGEKDLFHDPSVRIPLIVYDPRPEADRTRGTVCDALVEAIDLAPTFVEAMGGVPPAHVLEGRSLAPFLHGEPVTGWREAVFSEYDYSAMALAGNLGLGPNEARLFMVFDGRYKFIHAEGGFRPMLFDLETDPQELVDLGKLPGHEAEIERLERMLFDWARRPAQRTAISHDEILGMRGKSRRYGIIIGAVDPDELAPDLRAKISGRAGRDYRG
ncbi:alkaline phosphatase family protein [Neotabrizicola shimadae]|uniref:Alkaline phosphatase family protein n=1 Tax=Neotabrizicola shimadae TaxID=2807096 RepID=A0A8G0ZVD4_9RHOB|nr:alkaline phosphatase family protein [Neotabrizicola shimadae]QYZ69345.1 alkaline phosphatase family protein [Neotabrizicola shimadae]